MRRFAPFLASLALVSMLTVAACERQKPDTTPVADTVAHVAPPSIPEYTYRIVHQYPHDTSAFTEGLLFHDGRLLESVGREGQSSLREVELESGRIIRRFDMPAMYFGEGLTLVDGRLYQLTYRHYMGFVYDLASFKQIDTFQYTGEGWGLTTDGHRIIMSDGTSTLRFLNPDGMTLDSTKEVTIPGVGAIKDVNELEWVDGEIWANVWQTDRIARIDPKSGAVIGWIDLAGLLKEGRTGHEDVLNGIAYDAAKKRVFVTGKLWPFLFEIQVIPKVRPA
jgi:glutaminyl-peptide cyclotransferase